MLVKINLIVRPKKVKKRWKFALFVGYQKGAHGCSQDKQSVVSSNIVKLQLASSGNLGLHVIILHWSTQSAGRYKRGNLFVYGGDNMDSEEVLTVLWEDSVIAVI